MADEGPKPPACIPEAILKKRKSNEDWAIRRKQQLEYRIKKSKGDNFVIKKPEQFIKEYRDGNYLHYHNVELDLVQMKHRGKQQSRALVPPESKLLFVIRIGGKNDMHPKTRKILHSLRLGKIFNGVFVRTNERMIEFLRRVEPYITYGYPNFKNVKDLIYKKGLVRIDKQRVPLTDNNVIEQALGKYGTLCIEDIVNEIDNVGQHFKEVSSFLCPSMLNKPEKALQGKKRLYKDGGDTGSREDHINELIKGDVEADIDKSTLWKAFEMDFENAIKVKNLMLMAFKFQEIITKHDVFSFYWSSA
ncbi:hypothetical protein F0562_023134 [Nyssa sinensis]|uniref:Large ribosomal subunit protein uL30-like ferredoxin-like fold domain-containing protein n=1 Tax=Nyssa sinensis TaxID=561372 RepID=A0A5J5BJU4_9ASTE|nr:hypothetical protein F0562_023134 [Nyssa sinensis]